MYHALSLCEVSSLLLNLRACPHASKEEDEKRNVGSIRDGPRMLEWSTVGIGDFMFT
jgi:hypothetical protein